MREHRRLQTPQDGYENAWKSWHTQGPFSAPCQPLSSSAAQYLMGHALLAADLHEKPQLASTAHDRLHLSFVPTHNPVERQNNPYPIAWGLQSKRLQNRL